MRRSAALLMGISLALLLTPFISASAKADARALGTPSPALEIPPSSSFLASAIHAIVSPDGSVLAQAAFLAPNYTLRVRGIRPDEVGYPGQAIPYPHGLEALALWARKGSPPSWGNLGGLLSGQGWPGEGDGGFLPLLASASHIAKGDSSQFPDKDKIMSVLFSPGLWFGMVFVGLSNEEDLFKAKAEQLASSVSDAYGVDMWLYMSFSFPLRPPEGALGEKQGPPWLENYRGFLFIYYADTDLEDVVDGFIEDLPDGTPCELVKNTTVISEAPYALYAYAMVDARLVALLIMAKQGTPGFFNEHGGPWPLALLAHGEHDGEHNGHGDGDLDFEHFRMSGWVALWFSERFVPYGVEENSDGTYTLSLNALFGHSGPICAGDLPDMETFAILAIELPWMMEVISVEPDEAKIKGVSPHFTMIYLLLTKGECVDDLLVVFEPRTSFPVLLLKQYADEYIVERGEEVMITIYVENVGNATAYNVMCIAGFCEACGGERHGHHSWGFWEENEPHMFMVDELPPGEAKSFNFTLRIDEPTLVMPAVAICFLEPAEFEIGDGETSLEELGERMHDFEARPGLIFFYESNTVRILTSDEEAPSLLAFLELDEYILKEGEPLNATLLVKNVGNAPAEDVRVDVLLFWRSMGLGFPFFRGGENCSVEEQLLGYIDLGPGEVAEINFTAPTEDMWGLIHLRFILSPFNETIPRGCLTAFSNSALAIVLAEMKGAWQLGVPYIIVEKSASKTHVRRGEVFTITLHVSNIGTATANDIIITEKLPHGLTYVGNERFNPPDPSNVFFIANSTHVAVKISSLAPGKSIDISFDVKAEEAGTYVLSSSPYECRTPLGASVNGFSEMLVVVVEEPGAGPGFTPEGLITPMALGVASIIATLAIGLYLARRK